MCKFIGKSNERILCKLSKSEILSLYSIVHVAMETTKRSNFTCQSKFFISVFFTCHFSLVYFSACELQPFSCHDLANDTYSKTAKTVFRHLKGVYFRVYILLRILAFLSCSTSTSMKLLQNARSALLIALILTRSIRQVLAQIFLDLNSKRWQRNVQN